MILLVHDYRGIKSEDIKLNDLVPMCRALPRNQYVDAHTPVKLLLPTKIAWLLEENLELLRNWLEFATMVSQYPDDAEIQSKESLNLQIEVGEELVDILHFVGSIADILDVNLAKVFLSKYKRNMRRKPTTFTSRKKKGKAKKEKCFDLEKDFGLHT